MVDSQRHLDVLEQQASTAHKQLPILEAALAAHQAKHTTKQKLEENPQAA